MTNPKISILAGGRIDLERREAALQHEKPRIDILEMEARLGARIFDFGWLMQRVEEEWFTRLLYKITRRFMGLSRLLALRAIRETKNDAVVYATGEDVGIPFASMLRLLHRRTPHVVVRIEQPLYGRDRLRRWIYIQTTRFGMPKINILLCRTKAHVDFFVERLKTSPNKVRFVPETVDASFFNPGDSAKRSVEIPNFPKPLIVSAGLELRDYPTLIKAATGLPVHVVIGAGSPWSHFRFDQASVPSLPDNVTVSSFSPLQMRELYKQAQLIVLPIHPTDRACGMNVILEAWAMAKPVIAAHTDGLADYVNPGKTGRFVEPGSPVELRSAILELLASEEEANRLAQNGHDKVATELYLEQYIRTIETILCELTTNPRKDLNANLAKNAKVF